ncbi:cullin-1-like [Rosa rugosa]|uniref:cullin-1-like n=1 Tax=Rosa rugosa TaxID=74645 RepID=UPI002B40C25C|nr:cullin-1-like [Rosa rugosa]
MEPSTGTGERNVVFNCKFRTQKKRLELPFHKLIDKKKVIEKVDRERINMIDIALVRVAKNQKIIDHKDLIRDCVEQVQNFKPDITVIERQISSLVCRDYLEKQKPKGAPEALYIYLP